MQPQLRQMPPKCSRSTTAVFMPSCAARIAATYPPGPPPTTMMSKDVSAKSLSSGSVSRLLSAPKGGEGIEGAVVALRSPRLQQHRHRRLDVFLEGVHELRGGRAVDHTVIAG